MRTKQGILPILFYNINVLICRSVGIGRQARLRTVYRKAWRFESSLRHKMAYLKTNKLHIVAVVAVIKNNEGKFLVLKRSKKEIAYPGMYTFPGGKIEGNDTVEETLIKEVKEECGLTLKSGKILLKDKSFIRPDEQTAKVFSYLCETENCDNIKLEDDFIDYKWVTVEDLKDIPHVGIEEELLKAEMILRSGIDLKILETKSEKV